MLARSLGWIAVAVSLLAQQPQPATPQLPSFRSGVDIARLDVLVLDKDRRPVRGLTAADFAVTVLPLRALTPGSYLLTVEAKTGALATRRDVRFSIR